MCVLTSKGYAWFKGSLSLIIITLIWCFCICRIYSVVNTDYLWAFHCWNTFSVNTDIVSQIIYTNQSLSLQLWTSPHIWYLTSDVYYGCHVETSNSEQTGSSPHWVACIYLISVLSSTKEYLTFTTAASIAEGGNQAVPGGNPQPCTASHIWSERKPTVN